MFLSSLKKRARGEGRPRRSGSKSQKEAGGWKLQQAVVYLGHPFLQILAVEITQQPPLSLPAHTGSGYQEPEETLKMSPEHLIVSNKSQP